MLGNYLYVGAINYAWVTHKNNQSSFRFKLNTHSLTQCIDEISVSPSCYFFSHSHFSERRLLTILLSDNLNTLACLSEMIFPRIFFSKHAHRAHTKDIQYLNSIIYTIWMQK
jgi:hypothetical protein